QAQFRPGFAPRLLEADSKSLRSVNGSRRSSGSSLVSSSSASSNLGHLEEDTWILWGRIVNEWDDWRRKKEKLLKELIRKGIPQHFRAIVWQLLCSAAELPLKAQYSELLRMSSPCERLIRRDIARTYPEHDFFKGQDSLGQEVLFNVMKVTGTPGDTGTQIRGGTGTGPGGALQRHEGDRDIWGHGDTNLGWDRDRARRCSSTSMPEEEAFSVFVRLMQEYRLRELFKPSMYFQKVIPHQFDSCPDTLILRACQVKYNPKKMKRLEKEYAALKSKEMEEQIEIKIVPNCPQSHRLLKQRIETLEKESAALADRLIQGQVTRAQEAEENDVIRRELALVRQRWSAATESLRVAQSTIRELQGNPRLTEEFVAHLETELERSRLRESETLGALKEMRDKVLHMEQRQPLLPDDSSVVRLQEELQELALSDLGDTWQVSPQVCPRCPILTPGVPRCAVPDRVCPKCPIPDPGVPQVCPQVCGRWQEPRALREVLGVQLRESQSMELRALRERVLHLETQGRIQRSVLGRAEQTCAGLREQLRAAAAQSQGLQAQLSESHRKHTEAQCKSKEEVMAVRLREADSMAALAEMRQRVAELEIQREEGRLQGQLEHSDAAQYIRHLRGHIRELKAQVGHGDTRQPLLPDDSSVVRLQEELQELALSDLGDTWQVCP
ncbi:PREDICTED: EVI5-like protein, partial [Ficedula albicollis]|uniref:EVI5-like protein n=1 Tax=Ficedula albicollis TaxID=59894 RepID=UPI0007AD918E